MNINLIRIYKTALAAVLVISAASCAKKEARLEMNFADKFEGETVELMNYADSTVIATTVVKDGKAVFVAPDSMLEKLPLFTNLQVDGRIRAFYVAEPGKAFLADSLSVASGTPLNDRFSSLMRQLDSIENLDDMEKYVEFSEKCYNENKENPLGEYFCIEWLKYADPSKVDSLLKGAPASLRDTHRVKYYENFARHRALTSPGEKYTDFAGTTAKGAKLPLSSLVKEGKYTIVDFWASWCPYCIKELPELSSLYSDYKDKGLEIVGVAVRDKVTDTETAVEKHGIAWPVIYDTQKIPYDIYGFSGIPHHMLIGPDGRIVSRGENVATLRARLETLLK